jgi:hypothetical protein
VPNVGWKKTFKGEERLVGPCTVGGAGDFVLGVREVCVTDLSLLHVCWLSEVPGIQVGRPGNPGSIGG